MSKIKAGIIVAAVSLSIAGAAPAFASHSRAQSSEPGREHLDMGHPTATPRSKAPVMSFATRERAEQREYLDTGIDPDTSAKYQHRYFGGPKSIH